MTTISTSIDLKDLAVDIPRSLMADPKMDQKMINFIIKMDLEIADYGFTVDLIYQLLQSLGPVDDSDHAEQRKFQLFMDSFINHFGIRE